jgi:hypothetical protein
MEFSSKSLAKRGVETALVLAKLNRKKTHSQSQWDNSVSFF